MKGDGYMVGPTDEDTITIANYIYLTTLIEVLEHDLQQIKKSNLSMNISYVALLEFTLKRIRKDLAILRKKMSINRIKVFERKREYEDIYYWEYVCRGFTGQVKRWSPALRSQCNDVLLSYFQVTKEKE